MAFAHTYPPFPVGQNSPEVARRRVQRWDPGLAPDAIYSAILYAIAAHDPTSAYSMLSHGSAVWGGRTVLRNGLPVSDIDVLVIGLGISDLIIAARALHVITRSFLIPAMPFFKLSAKFRTFEEIASDRITVNELAALWHGKLLCGASDFEVYYPNSKWFYCQAHLSARTRIAYVLGQREKIRGNRFEQVLSRYLAARILLDIPTLALVSQGILGRDYAARIRRCLQLLASSTTVDCASAKELAIILDDALRTKLDPEKCQCGSIEEATLCLLDYAARLGIGPLSMIESTDNFWERERPLDARDHAVWCEATGR